MLDSFEQLFQHCWGDARALRMVTMEIEFSKFTRSYGSCPSHNTLHVLTLLGVVASVCTGLNSNFISFEELLDICRQQVKNESESIKFL